MTWRPKMDERAWLHQRGLTDKTIAEAGLLWQNGVIKIPWRIDGKEVGYQKRWIEGKKIEFNQGFNASTLYLPTGQLPKGYDIWVAEGPWDTLILHQLGYPVVGIVSSTNYTGVATIPCRNLCLALDNDEPGNLAAESILALGTTHTICRVAYEGKDPNECVLAHGGAFPHEVMPYLIGGIKHHKEIHLNGNLTQNSILDFSGRIPRWTDGDLVVLYGAKGGGKTSWLQSLLAQYGISTTTLFEEYEMLPEKWEEWFRKMGGTDQHNVYLTTEYMDFNAKRLVARITSAVKSLGVKLVIIDTLHYHASARDNVVNAITSLTQKLKLIAMNNKIAVVVIMHETDGNIRDCHLIGSADHILHLKRLKNSIIIEGQHRYAPEGTYSFPIALEEKPNG
jgi:hypothetical protein